MTEAFRRITAAIIALVFACSAVFADDAADSSAEAEPYTKEEFPQWAHDLRRTEIITFGSLPFVLLQSTIIYSFWRYYDNDYSSSYVPNPLANSSEGAGLDENEQKMLLATSAAISVGLGLIDFTVQLIRRYSKKRKAQRLQQEKDKNIVIEPIEPTEPSADDMPPPPDLPENVRAAE
ncbi:MAG: hypothetical protein II811_04630 [Spirochaetaceae bacterium]|nr:hypothetical protein [Spirochaetaceae bacterium]